MWLDREDAIVRNLDFALNAIEVMEGFKQRSDIQLMFIKYPFEIRLTEDMGESDGYSTRSNRNLNIDRRERLS